MSKYITRIKSLCNAKELNYLQKRVDIWRVNYKEQTWVVCYRWTTITQCKWYKNSITNEYTSLWLVMVNPHKPCGNCRSKHAHHAQPRHIRDVGHIPWYSGLAFTQLHHLCVVQHYNLQYDDKWCHELKVRYLVKECTWIWHSAQGHLAQIPFKYLLLHHRNRWGQNKSSSPTRIWTTNKNFKALRRVPSINKAVTPLIRCVLVSLVSKTRHIYISSPVKASGLRWIKIAALLVI